MNTKIIHNKYIKRLTLIVFAVALSLVSSKVNAVDLSLNVEHLGTLSASYFFSNPIGACNIINNSQPPYTTATGACAVTAYVTPAQTGFNNQYILGLSTYAYNLVDNNIIYSYENNTPSLVYLWNSGYDQTATYVGMTTNQISTSSTIITHYFRLNTSGSSLGTLRYTSNVGIKNNEFLMVSSAVEVLAVTSPSGNVTINDQNIVNAIRQAEITNQQWLQTINTNLQTLMQNMNNNQGSINNINNNIQNSIDQTQQASDEGTANANQSQSDNEAGSSNILGIVGQVIGAFNTSNRECSIPINTGNLNLGDVNFCSGKPAAWQQMLGGGMTIVLVYAIYKVALAIFQWFISMTAIAQGGGWFGRNE